MAKVAEDSPVSLQMDTFCEAVAKDSGLDDRLKGLAASIVETWKEEVQGLQIFGGFNEEFRSLEARTTAVPMYADEIARIENLCLKSALFRYIHIEVLSIGRHLNVVHCTVCPHFSLDCPILGMDIVARNGHFAFTVADLSPVSAEDKGPPTATWFESLNAGLFQTLHDCTARSAPEWGKEIFSEGFVALQPNDDTDGAAIADYMSLLNYSFVTHARQHESLLSERDPEVSQGIRERHIKYCLVQRGNQKTMRTLELLFGKAFAGRYMEQVLFPLP